LNIHVFNRVRSHLLAWVLLLALAAGWPELFSNQAAGQDSQTNHWTQYINFDPPNFDRVKLELSGTEINLTNMLMKQVTIKLYSLTNDHPEMVAEAPECFWDRKNQDLNSSGPLQVRWQEGRFTVTGTGFLLDYEHSVLTISNQVHSLLRFQSGTNDPATPLTEIFSQSARFESKSNAPNNLLDYLEHVRVSSPEMKASAEFLTAEVPKGGADQTNRVTITTKTNVVIDFQSDNGDPIHATGEQAVYTSDSRDGITNKFIDLTGNPRIELTNGWMTAERFLFDQTTGKLRGNGNFHFHYLGQAGAQQTSTAAAADLFSERFEMDTATRVAEFWGGVRADSARMQLTSEWLTATLPKSETGASNHPEHWLARTNVVLDFADTRERKLHATGQQAAYDYKTRGATTNEVLELTGNPTVETTGTNRAAWMTADVITVDRAQGKIRGTGNHHSVFKKNSDETATMDTEVYSDSFDYASDTGLAVYHDDVRVYDPEMNATAGKTLTIKLAKPEPGMTNQIDSFHGDGGVVIDFVKQPFYPGDLTNLSAFAARMRVPADPVAHYISTNLADATRELLTNYTGGTNPPLQRALVEDLNQITQRGALYDPARFARVYRSLDATELLEKHPLGVDLVELNRLLLLDAFRGELTRNQKGEKTHATGGQADYDYKSPPSDDEILELSGHPRVEQPESSLTAEDKIIYDLTTQKSRTIGKSRVIKKLEKVKSLPGQPKK
jgi:lipopolysaccharide export system protein LptA